MPIQTVFMLPLSEGGKVPVKVWTNNIEATARKQLELLSTLPFIHKHVAVMPDVHAGIGSTVGTVLPTKGAILPAAVGVDIGCGMMAVETTLKASDLPESLRAIRDGIERAVPHGFVTVPGRSVKGSWEIVPNSAGSRWRALEAEFDRIIERHPKISGKNPAYQLGSLGGGNHFIEVCLDLDDTVWVMLHSGSRGIGNQIGRYFIELAREDMRAHHVNLPDQDLAYLSEGTQHFDDYTQAMFWAQTYAMENRSQMMDAVLRALREHLPTFQLGRHAVNCHHNYVSQENHYGENVYVTRKGAVRAREGELGIIPGSMGARSFIVRGKGNPESFCSCSHGAGRVMSRTQARKTFTLADLATQTAGVECRKDEGVLDETPGAYKNIDEVMAFQSDLVEPVAQLRQVLCVKG
jgi:tRNA-splicing ligase RtcB